MVRAVERLRRFGRTRCGSSRKDHPGTFTECHPRDTRRRRTLFEVSAPERTGRSRSTTPTDVHHDRYRGAMTQQKMAPANAKPAGPPSVTIDLGSPDPLIAHLGESSIPQWPVKEHNLSEYEPTL